MAKKVDSTVLDAALNTIKNGAVSMTVTAAEPASAAAAASASLATVTMAPADMVVAAGTGQGRRLTTAVKNGITITASGTAGHVSLHSGSVLHYVTTCTSQALTTGGGATVNIPAWNIEIAGPT